MGKFVRLATVLAVTMLAAAMLSACGSSNKSSGGGNAKSGGSITVGTVGPDSYDPVLFQTIQASQALMPVYLPLLTYKHESGAAGSDLVPGLAEKMPTVTNGGKTYALQLRKGLKYDDGSPVKASDFTNTIKRLVILGGPYSSFLTGIKGAEGVKTVKDDIPGIKADDATGKITITLTTADGKFPFALAEPYAAPTPAAKSPAKSLTKNPPPGAGEYKIDVVDPSKKFILTKNPNFNVPGLPKGNLDKITGVVETVPRMTQDVINNKIDFMTEDPTGDLLVQVKQKYKDRFRLDPNPPNTYYFFLNETVAPFDKLEARQAVNYALDSRALQRLFSGRLKPTCSFLAPGVIGYKEPDPCPWGDPNGPPQIDKAKELVKKSGTAGQSVTVWTNTKDPRPAIGDYYRDMLNQIGYKAKTKTLDQQVYFDQVGNPKNKAQTGFTDWFQDFPHPADFFEPLLSAKALKSNPTFNLSFKADPDIDKVIAKLTPEPDPQKVADQWAALDQEVTGLKKAHVAVYGSEQSTTFMSDRMDFQNCNGVHPVYKNDWIAFCLK
jgi:peptide/nickel transport system substrate-binding protein